MRVVGAFVAFVLLVACSSSPSQPSGPCAQRHGTYRYNFTRRDGDCGSIPEQVVTVDEDVNSVGKSVAADPPCSGRFVSSADNCSVTVIDLVCPEAASGGTSKMNGKVYWAHDGAGASGIVSFIAYDSRGAVLCSGSYDLTYEKI